MRKVLFALALFSTAALSHAAVLFSTGWDSPASTATDSVLITGNATAQGIAITGNGSNQPSPAGFWTVTDSAKVDLSSATFITNGTNSVGNSTGADILRKGAVFTTATDFSYLIGANNSAIRYATNSTSVWAPQANAAGANDLRFNVLFEIKSGTYDTWNVQFNYGTASTAGAFSANSTAAQNGLADVDIYSVAGNGSLSLTSLSFTGVSLSGTGPLANLSATNPGTSLSSGNYLLSISLTGKTLNQRYTIDNLVVSAVPEPATWGVLALALTALLVLRRRSQGA